MTWLITTRSQRSYELPGDLTLDEVLLEVRHRHHKRQDGVVGVEAYEPPFFGRALIEAAKNPTVRHREPRGGAPVFVVE